MGVILDILGSFVVRAAIVVVILNMMINLHQSLSKNTDRIQLNNSIYGDGDTVVAKYRSQGGLSQVIEADIKLAGYNATKTFAIAKQQDISFSADTGNTGTAQIIRYYTSPVVPSMASKSILYRTVNAGTALEVARNIFNFSIVYYDVNGALVAYGINKTVKSIYVTLEMASGMTERTYQGGTKSDTLLTVKWQRHFFPENL